MKRTTQPKMRGQLTTSLLAALVLLGGAGMSHAIVAQANAQATTPAPRAAPAAPKRAAPARRARARRPARPRVQTAPTRDRIVEIQNALSREGFYAGKPSGRWDAATTAAMKKFQTANELTATGKVGALSLQALGLGSEVAGRGAPLPPPQGRASVLSESELLATDPETP